MLKGIIFDFDGVIAESLQVKTDAFAALYSSYDKDLVRKIVKHHEANGGMSRFEKFKYYHEIFLNKSITRKQIRHLDNQFSNLVKKKVISVPYIPGAFEYIQKCSKKYKLFISTGTPTEEINYILEGKNIIDYFTDVFGSPSKKIEHLNIIMSKYNMKPNELLFYGDSSIDMEAANYAKIPFILIRNRFNKKLTGMHKGKIIKNFIGIT